MDQHTFDRITRTVAAGQTRRALLRRLLGAGAAVAVGHNSIQSTLAAPVSAGAPDTPALLREPSDVATLPAALQPQPDQETTCPEPLIDADCGCIDPATQTCCQDAICDGTCTRKDGCCDVSTDLTDQTRGEICGDHCCHPHLSPTNTGYSECCEDVCCAGHCYAENLCCPVADFCPGTVSDLCCADSERCCGVETAGNLCIADIAGSCCSVSECTAEPGACYVTCDAGLCRQHFCSDGAVCCSDAAGLPVCVAGNCCSDADCGTGEACLSGICTAVECFVAADCAEATACSLATCTNGVCSYSAACPGDCAVCTDGVCSTDDTLCGLCGTCNAGICTPVSCPEGYSCYSETGECLGVA